MEETPQNVSLEGKIRHASSITLWDAVSIGHGRSFLMSRVIPPSSSWSTFRRTNTNRGFVVATISFFQAQAFTPWEKDRPPHFLFRPAPFRVHPPLRTRTYEVATRTIARRAFARQPRVAAERSVAATLGFEPANPANPERVPYGRPAITQPLRGKRVVTLPLPRVAAARRPVGDFDATGSGACACNFCQGWRAANALRTAGSESPDVASFDSDLERVTAVWGDLPVVIRQAVLALIGSNNQDSGKQRF